MKIVGSPNSSRGAGRFVRWGARHRGLMGILFARYDSWRNRRRGGGIFS